MNSKKENILSTRENLYVIWNSKTGDIKIKIYITCAWSSALLIPPGIPQGYKIIASHLNRFEDEIFDLSNFESCGTLKLDNIINKKSKK